MRFKKTSEEKFLQTFMSILRNKTGKNNTYKFALARFLLEYSNKNTSSKVRFSKIAEYFFKYYWLQDRKSKLRQGPESQLPTIIKTIRKEFNKNTYPQSFQEIKTKEAKKVAECTKQITRTVSKDVIHRFQKINKTEKKIFYDYFAIDYKDSGGNKRLDPNGGILLNKNAMSFFRKNFVPLHKAVILEWIRFLESRNFGVPKMVQKIEGKVPQRQNQKKFIKILQSFGDQCFYCENRLAFDKSTHVDHVIPFDYIGTTEIWNLVAACQKCNCKKLGSLPPEPYLQKLLDRNKKHKNTIQDSLNMLEYDDHDISWHYTNAFKHGYQILENFPILVPS